MGLLVRAASDESRGLRSPGALALVLLATLLSAAYGATTRHGPALADEHFYLASARFFGDTGSLNARFYDEHAILQYGHPHHEWHTPGYVILLGLATRLTGQQYWAAVALNFVAYAGLALLVRSLTISLGLARPAPFVAGALALLLPAYLPYVFWAMPEVLLGALFVASLAAAARDGSTRAGAAASGVLLGLAILVRETALFGSPALFGLLLERRGRWRSAALALLLFLALVYVPLQSGRPGGLGFWKLPWGHPAEARDAPPGGRAILFSLQHGLPVAAASAALDRATWNLRQVWNGDPVEAGILGHYLALALTAAVASRRLGAGRGLLAGLWLGFAAMGAVLLCAYTLTNWGGFRYLMFLLPGFLPFVAAPQVLDERPSSPVRAFLLPALLALSGCILAVSVFVRLTSYKVARQRRWQLLSAYVEPFLTKTPLTRVVLPNGWRFGLDHYPVEVISSLDDQGGRLRALEQAVTFEYLVVPGNYSMIAEIETRTRYERVNRDETHPPVYIYRRLR